MSTLLHLPLELLLQIHLFSLSPSLPLLTKSLHSTFHHSPSSHKAAYIVSHCDQSEKGIRKAVQKCIRFPIGCTLDVVRAVEREAERRLQLLLRRGDKRQRRAAVQSEEASDGTSTSSKRSLKCPHLTRTLLSASPIPFELILYLLSYYHSSPNSANGYLLSKAVLLGDLPLMELFLEWGADSGMKNGWAVRAAIEKDWTNTKGESDGLRIVKKLMLKSHGGKERRPDPTSSLSPSAERDQDIHSSIEDTSSLPSPSPCRLQSPNSTTTHDPESRSESEKDLLRFPPSQKFLESAVKYKKWAIVDWLVEMGATPSLECLGML